MGHDSWATEEELATPCGICGKLPHRHHIFPFTNSPDYYREHGLPEAEWLSFIDTSPNTLYHYPPRVAYQFNDGEPVVMVHEGPDEGLYSPCSYSEVNGLIYWICTLKGPKNPADLSYMEDISS